MSEREIKDQWADLEKEFDFELEKIAEYSFPKQMRIVTDLFRSLMDSRLKSRWIPVSERLPDMDRLVWLELESGKIIVGERSELGVRGLHSSPPGRWEWHKAPSGWYFDTKKREWFNDGLVRHEASKAVRWFEFPPAPPEGEKEV